MGFVDFVFILIFILLLAPVLWSACKGFVESEHEKQYMKDLRERLKEEEKNPKCYIEFELTTGEFRESKLINPYIANEYVYDSYLAAEKVLEYYLKEGFFQDRELYVYPAGSVKRARIVQMEKL